MAKVWGGGGVHNNNSTLQEVKYRTDLAIKDEYSKGDVPDCDPIAFFTLSVVSGVSIYVQNITRYRNG